MKKCQRQILALGFSFLSLGAGITKSLAATQIKVSTPDIPSEWSECLNFEYHPSDFGITQDSSFAKCISLYRQKPRDLCIYGGMEAMRLGQPKAFDRISSGTDLEEIDIWQRSLFPNINVVRSILSPLRSELSLARMDTLNYSANEFIWLLTTNQNITRFLLEAPATDPEDNTWANNIYTKMTEEFNVFQKICSAPKDSEPPNLASNRKLFKFTNEYLKSCENSLRSLTNETYIENLKLQKTQGYPIVKPYAPTSLYIQILSDLSLSEPLIAISLNLLKLYKDQKAPPNRLFSLLEARIGKSKSIQLLGFIATTGPNIGLVLRNTALSPKLLSASDRQKLNRLKIAIAALAQLIPYFDAISKPGEPFSLPDTISTSCSIRKSYHFWAAAYNAWNLSSRYNLADLKNNPAIRNKIAYGSFAAAHSAALMYQLIPMGNTTSRHPMYIYSTSALSGWNSVVRFDLTMAMAGAYFGAYTLNEAMSSYPQAPINLDELIASTYTSLELDPNGFSSSPIFANLRSLGKAMDTSPSSEWITKLMPYEPLRFLILDKQMLPGLR